MFEENENITAQKDHFISGIAPDMRSDDEKAQDYQAHEVMAFAAPVNFIEKNPEDWRTFPLRNQNGSGTCVAQTDAKLLGIENFLEEGEYLEFSAVDVYSRRFNKPDSGMAGPDALKIASDFGACFQDDLNDQLITEEQANQTVTRTDKMVADAKRYRAGGYVQIPLSVDAIASFIDQKQKGVMMFISFDYNEWNDTPTVAHDGPGEYRHSVTGVDFALHNGVRGIVIDDSWGRFNNWKGQRFLSEAFLKQRLYFAGALLNLKNSVDEQPLPLPRPHFKFTRALSFGATGPDVVALQNMLKYENLFPRSLVSTGLYLQITAKAVKAWQVKNNILDFSKETDMRKVRFGDKSVKLANIIYA